MERLSGVLDLLGSRVMLAGPVSQTEFASTVLNV